MGKLFHAPDTKTITGRKKTLSPARSPKRKSPFRVQKKDRFEQKNDEENEENEFKSPPKSENITIFLSKSIQTKPEVLTPKMNKTQTNKLKENVMGYKTTQSIHASDPLELLPPDIMEKLNKLEQDGKLKDVKDFDIHFRELLGAHCDRKKI